MGIVAFGGDTVLFGSDTVIFGLVEADPPTAGGGLSPLRLFIDSLEVGAVEWSANGEEVLGGIGRATVVVQDRLLTDWEPRPHADVVITIRDTGWRLFHGEIMLATLSLPPGMPIRRWELQCRDYNGQLDERLVGAPVQVFWRPNDTEAYRAHDPAAVSGGTDEVTIEQWADAYFRFPDGTTVDTDEYVFEYVPNSVLGAEEFILHLEDATTTLRGAVDLLAAMADVNVQDWIDPDKKWHHQAIPAWPDLIDNDDPTDLDDAPYGIVDLADNPDGTTEIGHAGITITVDGQTMPEQLYAQGATGYVYDPNVSVTVVVGGSGYLDDGIADPAKRQAYLPIPDAWEQTRRDAVLIAAMTRAVRAALRATVWVTGWRDPATGWESRDGWRVGQRLPVSETALQRLPVSMRPGGRFVIQRVAWSLIPRGNDIPAHLRYGLDIGDGAIARISQRQRNQIEAPRGPAAQKPVVEWVVDALDLKPLAADESLDLVFYPRNGKGEAWAPPGMPVEFHVEARDADPASPTYGDIVLAQGSFSPGTTTTDEDGRARTTFTAGDQNMLDYDVWATSDIAPA